MVDSFRLVFDTSAFQITMFIYLFGFVFMFQNISSIIKTLIIVYIMKIKIFVFGCCFSHFCCLCLRYKYNY